MNRTRVKFAGFLLGVGLAAVGMLGASSRADSTIPVGLDPNAIAVSARSGKGLDRLAGSVAQRLSRDFLDVDVEVGVEDGRSLAYLAHHGEVLSKHYHNGRVTVHCRVPKRHVECLAAEGIAVRRHLNGGEQQAEVASDWPSIEEVA